MKLRSLNADGSANDDTEFDLEIVDQDGDSYDPPVTVRCRLLPPDVRRKFERKATRLEDNPNGRGKMRVVDSEELTMLSICWAVLSWANITTEDGQDIACVDSAKRLLPPHVIGQISTAIVSTEVADQDASFRELTRVV